MKVFLKLLLTLVVMCLVGLVVYTYLGPMLGADFSAPTTEIRVPVTLDAN